LLIHGDAPSAQRVRRSGVAVVVVSRTERQSSRRVLSSSGDKARDTVCDHGDGDGNNNGGDNGDAGLCRVALEVVATLRGARVPVIESVYNGGNAKKRLRRAAQSGAALAVVVGREEMLGGFLTVRRFCDMDGPSTHTQQHDQQPREQRVPREALVERVRHLLEIGM